MELSSNMYWLDKNLIAQNDQDVPFKVQVTVSIQLLIFHSDFQADSLQYMECIYIIHIYMYTTSAQQVFT